MSVDAALPRRILRVDRQGEGVSIWFDVGGGCRDTLDFTLEEAAHLAQVLLRLYYADPQTPRPPAPLWFPPGARTM